MYFLSYLICWKVAYYGKLEGEIWFKDAIKGELVFYD